MESGGLWSCQNTFALRIFFAPLPSLDRLFWSLYVLPRFHFQLIFILLESMRGTSMLCRCIVLLWGQLQPALWYARVLIIHWRHIGGFELTFVPGWFFLFDIFTIFILVQLLCFNGYVDRCRRTAVFYSRDRKYCGEPDSVKCEILSRSSK